jgi:hypothetical protein
VVEGVQQRLALRLVGVRLPTFDGRLPMQPGGMRGLVDGLELEDGDVGVDRRRFQLGMAERTRLTLITFLRY